MLILGLLVMALGLLIIGGCGLLHVIGSNEIMGQYSYVHTRDYTGPVNREIPIWISKDFGEADQVEIARAVEQWNYVLNGFVHLTIVDTAFNMEIYKIKDSVVQGGWLIMKINSDNPIVPIPAKPGLWTLAFVDTIGGSHMYFIRDRLQNEDMFGVAMHEMGHLLGAPHVGRKLMYYKFSRFRYQCVDPATAKAVAEHQGMAPDDLNYCVDNDTMSFTQTPSTSTDEVSNCPLEGDRP